MTPLARTAILPATVFTPCLNCAMSGPEGSTLSKPDGLPETVNFSYHCVAMFYFCLRYQQTNQTFVVTAVPKQVGWADGGASRHALQSRLGLVLRTIRAEQCYSSNGFAWVAAEEALTSALLSRPKNMSEEIAFALANFCLASLDSDTGADASAFRLLGTLH